jgi:hypothetical protein
MRNAVLMFIGCLALATVATRAQGGDEEQRVAALKQSIQSSQARLRQFEWVETRVISLKGEEKAREQNRCYYGADGKVQKVPVGDQPTAGSGNAKKGGRLKQQMVEKKKNEMQEYMERAGNLIQLYVPPNPQRIQAAKDAGKLAVRPTGSRLRLEFTNYLKDGDMMAIEVDAKANSLLGISVSTYLDKPDDQVKLDVRQGALEDGTAYTAQTTLDASAKNIRVVIMNSGYRPIGK